MCNRFRSIDEWSETYRSLVTELINFEFNPNVAPTETVPAFLSKPDSPIEARLARFGITLPAKGAGKPFNLMNVRRDTLGRGSFSKLLADQRCIVPALGYYEWREENGAKQPYYFYRKDGQPISFACIWDHSEVKGDRVPSFAIITDAANETVAPYHDRMPVVISKPRDWLEGAIPPLEQLQSNDAPELGVRPVNQALNRVAEKRLEAIEAPRQAGLL
jgi:putative SOS response-associated peptidase YedK